MTTVIQHQSSPYPPIPTYPIPTPIQIYTIPKSCYRPRPLQDSDQELHQIETGEIEPERVSGGLRLEIEWRDIVTITALTLSSLHSLILDQYAHQLDQTIYRPRSNDRVSIDLIQRLDTTILDLGLKQYLVLKIDLDQR